MNWERKVVEFEEGRKVDGKSRGGLLTSSVWTHEHSGRRRVNSWLGVRVWFALYICESGKGNNEQRGTTNDTPTT